MRKFTRLSVLSLAGVFAVACSKSNKTGSDPLTADIQRDLKLANTAGNGTVQISPDENGPMSRPAPAPKLKVASSGPKVIRSHRPTVKASAERVAEAAVPEKAPEQQVTQVAAAPAPAETPAPQPAPVPDPTPAPAPAPGPQRGQTRGDGGGSTIGSILGGILGAVIRGGAVGDDHCSPRGHGGGVWDGGVYRGGGGMGGGRGYPGLPPYITP